MEEPAKVLSAADNGGMVNSLLKSSGERKERR